MSESPGETPRRLDADDLAMFEELRQLAGEEMLEDQVIDETELADG